MTDALECTCINRFFREAMFGHFDKRIEQLLAAIEDVDLKLDLKPNQTHLIWLKGNLESHITSVKAIKQEFSDIPEC